MVLLNFHTNVQIFFLSYRWLRSWHYMQVGKTSALPCICKCCISACVMILDQLSFIGPFKFPLLYFILVQFYTTSTFSHFAYSFLKSPFSALFSALSASRGVLPLICNYFPQQTFVMDFVTGFLKGLSQMLSSCCFRRRNLCEQRRKISSEPREELLLLSSRKT